MSLKPERKLNRWQGYDYSFPGLYFVTFCTKNRESVLGEIADNEMRLNQLGEIVKRQLLWLQDNFAYVRLDQWAVMPNHVHVIIEINYDFNENKTGYTDNRAVRVPEFPVGNVLERSLPGIPGSPGSPGDSYENTNVLPLYRIIGALKTTSSKLIHRIGRNEFKWQKSFHDRVIRDEDELSRIREYIRCNPGKWSEDGNNPNNIKLKYFKKNDLYSKNKKSYQIFM